MRDQVVHRLVSLSALHHAEFPANPDAAVFPFAGLITVILGGLSHPLLIVIAAEMRWFRLRRKISQLYTLSKSKMPQHDTVLKRTKLQVIT